MKDNRKIDKGGKIDDNNNNKEKNNRKNDTCII